jgi:triosephosphate isomerase
MNKTRAEARAFMRSLANALAQLGGAAEAVDWLVAPAFTALETVLTEIQAITPPGPRVAVAAQTMEFRSSGAYTGEVSPGMLADVGVQAVLLGHSERREYYNETDAGVAQKLAAASQAGLMPIVCVGERLQEREAGQTDAVVRRQVAAVLAQYENHPDALPGNLVFAYEPVWAIGTGKVCETAEANRVCAYIRAQLAQTLGDAAGQTVRILYGGSVTPDNAEALLQQPDIDGALIGGASLDVEKFVTIGRLGGRLPVGAS